MLLPIICGQVRDHAWLAPDLALPDLEPYSQWFSCPRIYQIEIRGWDGGDTMEQAAGVGKLTYVLTSTNDLLADIPAIWFIPTPEESPNHH